MLVALTEVYQNHQLFNSFIKSLLKSTTCRKCTFQHC